MTKPTHYYTAEQLGLTPEELADDALDAVADVDAEGHLRYLATGEGEPFPPAHDPGPAVVVNLRRSAYDVYIGRPGKGQAGPFGNPYRVGHRCGRCGAMHRTADETLSCFRAYLFDRAARSPEFAASLRALRGQRLGCFCKVRGDEPCHGDVIAAWIEADRAARGGG